MTGSVRYSLGFGVAVALVSTTAFSSTAWAQIVPDGTLGDEGSVVTDGFVRGDFADLIEGGAIRDRNLFHSFLEFNVDEGQRVYFANPDGIESILSRITGTNPSNIFGTLGVDGSADLFLLNPNGIVFGENAALDIEGSFYATAGEAIALGEEVFSATEPEQSRLLTVNPSVLFENYLTDSSGDIENRGQLAAMGDLALAANNIDLQGQVAAGGDLTLLALDEVQIRDAVEAPFIGFAGGDLLVQGNQQVDVVALSHPDSGLYSYGDMVLRSANAVGGDTHYWSGGNFSVETLDDEAGNLYSPIDPIIRSLGDVVIDQYEGSSLHILAGGSVDIGTAEINEPDAGELGIDFLRETVTLSDGTIVEVDGEAQPTLDVRAGVSPEALGTPPLPLQTGFGFQDSFDGGGVSATEIPSSADITIGDGYIDALNGAVNGLILLTSQYQPNPDIQIGSILVDPEKGIYGDGLDARGFGGQGGAIYLDSRQNIELIDGFISTSGAGEVGDVVLLANDTISFDGQGGDQTGVFSQLEEDSTGVGGNIRIQSTNLNLLDEADLVASLSGIGEGGDVDIVTENITLTDGSLISNSIDDGAQGNSGELRLIVENSITVDDSFLLSNVGQGGEGDTGGIVITTGSLSILNSAQIQSEVEGAGNAGDVFIFAREEVVVDGREDLPNGRFFPSGIFTGVEPTGAGNGGNLEIVAESLSITNRAQFSSTTQGEGNAGDILISTQDEIFLLNSLVISEVTEGLGNGNGGDITLNTGSLDLLDGSSVLADTENIGDAGNITIRASERVTLTGEGPASLNPDTLVPSQISSTVEAAAVGQAGEIQITTGLLDIRAGGFIRASTLGEGNGGDIEITADLLSAQNGSEISSTTEGNGNAGDIFIGVQENVSLRNSLIITEVTEELGNGDGGDILIETGFLDLLDGSSILADTENIGDAGNITIRASERVTLIGQEILDSDNVIFNQISSTVEAAAIGEGGDIRITTGLLDIRDGGFMSASTSGKGNAGNVTISVDSFSAQDGAQILASTSGVGDSGLVSIDAQGAVTFQGRDQFDFSSGIFSGVNEGASGNSRGVDIDAKTLIISDDARVSSSTRGNGNAGNISVAVNSLNVQGGSQVSASTFGEGDAGSISIDAQDRVVFDGITDDGQFISGAFGEVGAGAIGSGGNINVTASTVDLLNGGRLQTTTTGDGNAGNISVEAESSLNINGFIARGDRQGVPSVILSANGTGQDFFGSGVGGEISLSAPLIRLNSGVVDARTFNSQPGGDITVRADFLDLFQSGQIVSASNGSGTAGTITVEASEGIQISGFDANFSERFSQSSELIELLQDESNISVRSFADGAAGDILLTTGELLLDERGQIIAESAAVDGGNITLNLSDLLLLRDNSLISASAGTEQAPGNGGNIAITTPFIVAIPDENSDIAADAFEGTGGNVSITARGVFGIEPRAQRTPLSDITASSQLGVAGAVDFNVLDTSFIEDNLSELSGEIVDTATLTAGSCIARADDSSGSFVVTGGEGLPQQPGGDVLSAYPTGTVQTVPESAATSAVQEPQGVYQLADGRLVLSHECDQ